MRPRLSIIVASAIVAIPSLSACGGEDTPPPENTGGVPGGGMSAALGGFAGLGAGGLTSAGGLGAVGSGGLNPAGSGGSGSGGLNTAGAPGASGSSSMVPTTIDTLEFVIEQAPCFGAGCHNDEMNPLDLRLDDQLYSRVTSRVSTSCGNVPVVNPGRPQESALVKILREPCAETPRMPPGCVEDQDALCVPPEYIAAIEQWIAMGAPQ